MILLLGCAAWSPAGGPADTEAGRVDTGVEHLPGEGEAVFDPDTLHAAELRLGEVARAALLAEPYEQVEATLLWDGVDMGAVEVRLRGGDGSFRPLDEKPKWKIELDKPGLDGLERIDMDSAVADCSYLRAPLALYAETVAGVRASRTGFSTLVVDGEDYGLYVLVEVHDEHFVDRHDIDGNVYDGSYLWEDGHIGQKLDLEPDLVDLYTLMEGEDNGRADLRAVADDLAPLDLDLLVRFFAAEAWVGHLDGYDLNQNNNEVVFDAEGRASLLGWDYDEAFLPADEWGMDWTEPAGRLGAWCRADPACHAQLLGALAEVSVTLDAAGLAERIEAWAALIGGAAAADPRRECSDKKVERGPQELIDWVTTRSADGELMWE